MIDLSDLFVTQKSPSLRIYLNFYQVPFPIRGIPILNIFSPFKTIPWKGEFISPSNRMTDIFEKSKMNFISQEARLSMEGAVYSQSFVINHKFDTANFSDLLLFAIHKVKDTLKVFLVGRTNKIFYQLREILLLSGLKFFLALCQFEYFLKFISTSFVLCV